MGPALGAPLQAINLQIYGFGIDGNNSPGIVLLVVPRLFFLFEWHYLLCGNVHQGLHVESPSDLVFLQRERPSCCILLAVPESHIPKFQFLHNFLLGIQNM